MSFTNSFEFLRGIAKDVNADVGKKIDRYQGNIQDLLQGNLEDLNINDGGFLAEWTFATFQNSLDTDFRYTIDFETTGVDYAKYVHFSKGTNKIYPNRRYLEYARDQTRQLIFTGQYQRKFAQGSPNKRFR
jgi:hypothetical protein